MPNEQETVRDIVSRWLKYDLIEDNRLHFSISSRNGQHEWPVKLDDTIPSDWEVKVKLPSYIDPKAKTIREGV